MHLDDPVDLLFGTQLDGGTAIHRALSYCQSLVRPPDDTILILISDLFEGGPAEHHASQRKCLGLLGRKHDRSVDAQG